MAAASFEHASEARTALRAIVSDPGHGLATLDNPQAMANLLQDLLPDAPREAGILTAAAGRRVAGSLLTHAEHGLDPATAIRLAAASLAESTAFTPQACEWAARELAVAAGLLAAADVPVSPAGSPASRAARAADATDATAASAAAAAPTRPVPTSPVPVSPAPASPAPGRRGVRRLGRTALVVAAVAAVIGGVAAGYQLARTGASHVAAPGGSSPQVSRGAGTAASPAGTPAASRSAASSGRSAATPPASPLATAPASPAPTTPAAAPGLVPDNVWIAQLDSVKQPVTRAVLDATLARVRLTIPQAQVLDSSRYASLVPGYWVIYYRGKFANGVQALTFCAAHGRVTANQCVGRYLSQDPVDLQAVCRPPASSPSGVCSRGPTTSAESARRF